MVETLTAPRLRSSLDLDGRRVGLTEFGVPDGRPLIWMHGTPGGSTQITQPMRDAALEREIRLVVVERPGYGRSTPHRYESMADWVPDFQKALDRLGIDRFAMAALSGGGPYTLAAARAMPQRMVSAAVLGGVTPLVGEHAHKGGVLNRIRPLEALSTPLRVPIGKAMGSLIRSLEPATERVWPLVVKAFPEGDRAVFEQPGMKEMFVGDIMTTSRRGLVGIMLDFALFVRDWGFDPAGIEVPVHFWHGDADPLVSEDQARLLAGAIPRSTLQVQAGESHLGGFARSLEALDAVLADWK